MEEKKLFKVEKRCVPEWGATSIEWTKYFLAENEDVVRRTIYERFGKPRYYNYERAEIVYSFAEVVVETLDKRDESLDDEDFRCFY